MTGSEKYPVLFGMSENDGAQKDNISDVVIIDHLGYDYVNSI